MKTLVFLFKPLLFSQMSEARSLSGVLLSLQARQDVVEGWCRPWTASFRHRRAKGIEPRIAPASRLRSELTRYAHQFSTPLEDRSRVFINDQGLNKNTKCFHSSPKYYGLIFYINRQPSNLKHGALSAYCLIMRDDVFSSPLMITNVQQPGA